MPRFAELAIPRSDPAYFGFFANEIGGVFMTPRELYESVGGRIPVTAAPQAAE